MSLAACHRSLIQSSPGGSSLSFSAHAPRLPRTSHVTFTSFDLETINGPIVGRGVGDLLCVGGGVGAGDGLGAWVGPRVSRFMPGWDFRSRVAGRAPRCAALRQSPSRKISRHRSCQGKRESRA